jgi:hypothetical protein
MMVSEPRPPTLNRGVHSLLAAAMRFKWAAFSALVIFLAVYWIDAWFAHHGLRPEATLLDDCLLSALTFVLGVTQQVKHERELKRHRQFMGMIADMNHHTRNALQVIVSRSVLSMEDSDAIEDISQAVKRIDWCLREILPNATLASDVGAPEVPRNHTAHKWEAD